jgi:ATP-dependent protease ClpP protease subunit
VSLRVSRTGDHATLFVEGVIGETDDAVEQLRGAERISVVIDCDGGNIAAAFRLYDALRGRAHTATILRVCGSAATILAFACERVLAGPSSQFLLHAPRVELGLASAEDLRESLALLDRQTLRWAALISKRTGAHPRTVNRWLCSGEDFWFSATEALSAGLADEILEPAFSSARAEATAPISLSEIDAPPGNEVCEPGSELLLAILRAASPVETRDRRRLARNVAAWFDQNVREVDQTISRPRSGASGTSAPSMHGCSGSGGAHLEHRNES